jgi:hypothetical protein
VIVRFHSGTADSAVGIKTQPESKPPGVGWQGVEKGDWVTEWFPGIPVNWKVITLPLVALMLGGINWKAPPVVVEVAPTCIV